MASAKMFDLSGKVAVVTGGNGGIGRGIALGLAEAGASVAILARNEERNRATLAELEALGRPAMALKLDVSQRKLLKPAPCDSNAVEEREQVNAGGRNRQPPGSALGGFANRDARRAETGYARGSGFAFWGSASTSTANIRPSFHSAAAKHVFGNVFGSVFCHGGRDDGLHGVADALVHFPQKQLAYSSCGASCQNNCAACLFRFFDGGRHGTRARTSRAGAG